LKEDLKSSWTHLTKTYKHRLLELIRVLLDYMHLKSVDYKNKESKAFRAEIFAGGIRALF